MIRITLENSDITTLRLQFVTAYYVCLCSIVHILSLQCNLLYLEVLSLKYREMSKNYIFRELECQMTKEEVAELCFKTVRTVTGWDEGKPIPPECKRLMRMAKGRELSVSDDWEQFKMLYDSMELPTGQVVRPQQILAGIALLGIQSELEIKTSTHLLRLARAISKIKI